MEDVLHDPEALYLHIRVLVGVVLGLGLTNLLKGFARIIEHPRQKPLYWVDLGWALLMFVYLMHFWWWEFRLVSRTYWTFGIFVFIVVFALIVYLLSALVFPESMTGYPTYRDYFYARRAWFFGIFATSFLFDLFDTWLKGAEYFHGLGAEYLIRNVSFTILGIIAIVIRNEKFHGAFVIGALVYEVSWIMRMYRVIA